MWDEDVGLAFIFSDKLLKLRDKYWLTGGEGAHLVGGAGAHPDL
jgi:hypothetical protein